MGKRQFRTDASPDYYEIEDGEAYYVGIDGSRTRVTDPDTRRLLLKGVSEEDPLASTSIRAFQNGELTVGNLFLNESEEESKPSTDMRARTPPGEKPPSFPHESTGEEDELGETSIERFDRTLTVGDLFAEEE